MKLTNEQAWSVSIGGLASGCMSGELARLASGADQPPLLDVRLNGSVVATIETTKASNDKYTFSVDLPNTVLSSGLSILCVCERSSGVTFASIPVFIDRALDSNVSVQLETLRAEVTALKQAFLREAAEPKLRAVERDLILADVLQAVAARQAGDSGKL